MLMLLSYISVKSRGLLVHHGRQSWTHIYGCRLFAWVSSAQPLCLREMPSQTCWQSCLSNWNGYFQTVRLCQAGLFGARCCRSKAAVSGHGVVQGLGRPGWHRCSRRKGCGVKSPPELAQQCEVCVWFEADRYSIEAFEVHIFLNQNRSVVKVLCRCKCPLWIISEQNDLDLDGKHFHLVKPKTPPKQISKKLLDFVSLMYHFMPAEWKHI